MSKESPLSAAAPTKEPSTTAEKESASSLTLPTAAKTAASELVNLYDRKACAECKISPELMTLAEKLRKQTPSGHIGRSFPSLRFEPKMQVLHIEGLVRVGGYGPHIVTDSGDLVDDAWNAVAKAGAVKEVRTVGIVFDFSPHREWFAQNNILLTDK
jgi:hypothetical protein